MQNIQNKIQKELDEQKEMLNRDCESYRIEFPHGDDENITISELIEDADFDSVDFNMGFEQGFMRGLECAKKLCTGKEFILTEEIIDAIDTMVGYDYGDEEKNYEENDQPEGHIFESIKLLEKFLNDYNSKK